MQVAPTMAEIGLVDYFLISEVIGIFATLIVVFYFSKKQTQKLSVDVESKILNDLDIKLHEMVEMAMASPEITDIVDKDAVKLGHKEAFAMNLLYTYSYAFHMHQRNVLKGSEWEGWIRTITATFKKGTIGEYWKTIQPEDWFDPEFQHFIDNEIIGLKKKEYTRG